jgi:hypothetical protein
MNAQNRRRCSVLATGGRPGDRSLPRSARSERLLPAIAPPSAPVLRRPLESTLPARVQPGAQSGRGVDGDLKQAVTRKAPARGKAQLKRAVVGHMRRLSKLPDRVRSFFGHRTFRYAA